MNVLSKSARKITFNFANKFSIVHPSPVIILGHLKSGTSAITILLGEATGKRAQNDIFCRIKDKDFRDKLYNRELSFYDFLMDNKFYFSAPIIKEPHFSFFCDEIVQCFPKAKLVFIVRDPRDNIRSILNYLNLPGNLTELTDSYRSQLSYEWQLKLDGYHPQVVGNNYIERLANRWNLAAEGYTKHKEKIILLRYEDFRINKVEKITELAQSVGLRSINDISNKVDVQYQKGGNSNTDLVKFFGKENLSKIEETCNHYMQKFGYE